MFRRTKKNHPIADNANDSYLSISDLMSSVVLILCLALIVFMFQFSQAEIKIKKQEDIIAKISEQLKAIEEKFRRIQNFTGNAIISIQNSLQQAGINVQVDPKTGNLMIESEFTFQRARSELTPEGKDYLNLFMPTYAKAIFQDQNHLNKDFKLSDMLDYILVIGNTSRLGDDAANMNLSLMRAKSIFDFVDRHPGFEFKENLLQKLHFTGRGEMDSKNPNGSDDANDRQIVFKFIFKRDKIDALMIDLKTLFEQYNIEKTKIEQLKKQ